MRPGVTVAIMRRMAEHIRVETEQGADGVEEQTLCARFHISVGTWRNYYRKQFVATFLDIYRQDGVYRVDLARSMELGYAEFLEGEYARTGNVADHEKAESIVRELQASAGRVRAGQRILDVEAGP